MTGGEAVEVLFAKKKSVWVVTDTHIGLCQNTVEGEDNNFAL
jgi:hypothetical protein